MASQNFFQACQDGNVEELRRQIDSEESVDLNGKDGYGMTALAYAARNGHVDVVRLLLSKNADRSEVLEQGYGMSHPLIAPLLQGLEQSASGEGYNGTESGEQEGIPPHSTPHAIPDGTYVTGNGFPQHSYGAMPPFAPHGQPYYYDGMHANGAPTGSGRPFTQGHARKDSNANLPPPDVARHIPCKFFPNCRYGDRCIFQHPVMAMPAAHPDSAPLSPSMTQPPMQPMFYQQMPAGYPYPAPYGAGPHFYAPMGPPSGMQQQYGVPNHFAQPIMQAQSQQQVQVDQAPQTSTEADPVNDTAEVQSRETEHVSEAGAKDGSSVRPSSETVRKEEVAQSAEGAEAKLELADERGAAGTPPQQDGPVPPSSENAAQGRTTTEAESSSQESIEKPVHRRQSFNSFLHHHAIPFQPSLQQPDLAMMGGMQPFAPRMGPKSRRLAGSNGYGKRNNGERPTCTFFAGGRCKFGDECRFPHLLADGTDARPLQAQQRQMFTAQYGSAPGANRATAAVNGAVTNGVPPSAPTGPQAEKKAAEKQEQQQELQLGAVPAQLKGSSQVQATSANGAHGSAGVARSVPSKTSTQQAAAAASRGSQSGSSGSNKKHSTQPSQRVPTVNDFPALAASSPNLSGQSSSTPISPSLNAQVVSTPSTHANAAEVPAAVAAAAVNGHPATPKANFSAILSAPAPAKANASPAKSAAADEEASPEAVRANGEDKPAKTSAKSNGKEAGKAKTKEVKAAKADTHRNVTAQPASVPAKQVTSNGVQEASDDFQLVHRSRASNKRGPSSHHSANNGGSNGAPAESYASQAKAVTA